MMKKVLSVLLCLAMCATMFSGVVYASDVNTHDGVEFEVVTELPSAPGTYCLGDDISLEESWNVPDGETKLCLHGHSISMTEDGDTIIIGESNTLTIYDYEGGGEITHSSGANGRGILNNGTLNLYEGSICGNTYDAGSSNAYGGGVFNQGTFNMYGGTIAENEVISTANAFGGGVMNHSSIEETVFNMFDGTIENNVATKGAGVYTTKEFNMYDGEITGNEALQGGGVLIEKGTFSMSGGSITENTVTGPEQGGSGAWGGGVAVRSGSTSVLPVFEVSGDAVIQNNTKKVELENYTKEKVNNVYLQYSGGKIITVAGLSDGASIGLTSGGGQQLREGTEIVVSSETTDDQLQYFTADDPAVEVFFDEDNNKLTMRKTVIYDVTTGSVENGTLNLDIKNSEFTDGAASGTKIVVLPEADEGYEIGEVKYNDGTDHVLTKNSDDEYSFVMPASDVIIMASFEEEASTPVGITYSYAYDVQRDPLFPSKIGEKVTVLDIDKPLKYGSQELGTVTRYSSNEGTWTLTEVGTYGERNSFSPAPTSFLYGVVSNVATNYGLSNRNGIVIHKLTDKDGTHVGYGVLIGVDQTNGCALFIGDLYASTGAGYFFSNEAIATATKEFNAEQMAESVYAVELDKSVISFGEVTEGYTVPAAEVVTITNAGDDATGDLTITLNSTDCFTLSDSSLGSIAVSGNDTFTVAPKANLAAGTYEATITVSGVNIMPKTVDVEFIVNEATYTVTFDENGHGTAPVALTDVVSGSKITAPTAPSVSGFTFGGWFKDEECTDEWDFDVDTVTGDITLYALWTEINYTDIESVTFNYAYDVYRSPAYPVKGNEVRVHNMSTPIGSSSKEGTWTLTKLGVYGSIKTTASYTLKDLVTIIAGEYTDVNADQIVIHELKKNGTHIAYGVVVAYDAEGGCALYIGDTYSSGAGYFLSMTAKNGEVYMTATIDITDFIDSENGSGEGGGSEGGGSEGEAEEFEASASIFYSTYSDSKVYVGIKVSTTDIPSGKTCGVEINGTRYPATSKLVGGTFVVDITSLDVNKEYVAKVYYDSGSKIIYADDVLSFKTPKALEANTCTIKTTSSTYTYTYYSQPSGNVGYRYNANGIDIVGKDGNGEWIQSSYGGRGWSMLYSNNTAVYHSSPAAKSVYNDMVHAWVVPEFTEDGYFVKLNYYLRNITDSDITGFRFGSNADVQIGSNDYAPIYKRDYGLELSDGTNSFALILNEGFAETPVTTRWFGGYSSKNENTYTEVTSDSLSNTDSGVAYSWQNITLKPGAIKTYSVVLGVGDSDLLNSLIKPNADIDYAEEALLDLDPGADYKITCNGTDYVFTADEDGKIPLSGKDKADHDYNFIGKTISVVKVEDGEESEAQEIEIGSRPDAVVPDYNDPGDNIPELPDDLDITTTTNSITVKTEDNQEYRIDGGAWVSGTNGEVTFTGLTENKEYNIDTRIKATSSSFASEVASVTVRTKAMLDITDIDISGTSHTYDGAPHMFTVKAEGGTVSYSATLTGTYTSSFAGYTDAGEYDVYYKISKEGYHDYYNVYKLTIEKAKVVKPVADTTVFSYTGSEQTYNVAANALYTISGNKRTNAGSQTVTVALSEKANYVWEDDTTADVTFTFAIGKAVAVIDVDTTPIVKTYGEAVVLPVATSNFGTVVCYTLASSLVNAGTYQVKYTVAGTDNYTGDEKTVSVTINPAKVAKPAADTTVFTYTGSEQTYNVAANALYTINGNKRTNAGSQTVTVALSDKANYIWEDDTTADLTFAFDIARKSVVGATIGSFNAMTYDGTAKTPVATVTIDGLTATGTWSDVTNVPDTSTFTASGNFEGTIADVNVGMQKATPLVTAPVAKTGLVYNTGAQVLAEAGNTTGGTLKYSLDNAIWSTEVPEGTDANDYTIYYKVEGDENYNDVAVESISVNIAKADMSAGITVAGYSNVFDNVPHAISVTLADAAEGAVITYSRDGVTYDAANPEYTDAGTYTVYYNVEKANYVDVTGSADVVITTKDITTAEIILGEVLTYNGNEQTVNYTVAPIDGLTITYDVAGDKATDVKPDGNYVLTITGTGNFTGTVTKEWNIIKATHPIEEADIPKAKTIAINTPLVKSILTPSELYDDMEIVIGTYAWEDPDEIFEESGTYARNVIFTPVDSINYVEQTFEINVRVVRNLGSVGGDDYRYFNVQFETNGGSYIKMQSVQEGLKVKEPEEPVMEGFTFDGWYKDKKLSKEYNFNTKVTEGFTLYAKWIEDTEEDKDSHNCPSKTFRDIDLDAWYHTDTDYVLAEGLMKGTSENEFAPGAALTRAMLVTVLYRLEGEPATNRSIPFADVDMGEYYANAVIWAQQNGIVKGISETEFAPDDNITREQIAAIMHRYAVYKEMDVTQGGMLIREFSDYEEISEYALTAMAWAVNTKLITGRGNNNIVPGDNATRAEIAAILHRFIEGNK